MARDDLVTALVGFCLETSREIVSTYREMSFAQDDVALAVGRLKDRLSIQKVEADFLQNLRHKLRIKAAGHRQPLEVLRSSDCFDRPLFLEVLCYVVACVDFLLQAGKDRKVYLEARNDLQPRLYEALDVILGLDDNQTAELDDMLVRRAEAYCCADFTKSGHMLMAYLPVDSCADRLTFSTAAYVYVVVATKKTFEMLVLDQSSSPGRFEFTCKRCSALVSGKLGELPCTTYCKNCGASFPLERVSTDMT